MTNYIKLGDGTKISLGDTFYACVNRLGRKKPTLGDGGIWIKKKFDSITTSKRLFLINHKYNPNYCCNSILLPRSKKRVKVGDTVWIWRNTNSNPALVKKVIINLCNQNILNNTKYFVSHHHKVIWTKAIDIAYQDNLSYYMPENLDNCYATQNDAIKDRQELFYRLEHCLMRIGREFGHRKCVLKIA
jgi:hypothetical protein